MTIIRVIKLKITEQFNTSILPSATGQCTWHETREHKAAHAQVDVHRSHTCRPHTVSEHQPRTVHWSCMTAAGQCHTEPSHAVCHRGSRQDSTAPVNITTPSLSLTTSSSSSSSSRVWNCITHAVPKTGNVNNILKRKHILCWCQMWFKWPVYLVPYCS